MNSTSTRKTISSAILIVATLTLLVDTASGADSKKSALPDPLLAANGKRITTVEQWETVRRPELMELFREHVYGRNPVERPDAMRFEVLSTESVFGGKALRRQVRITCTGPRGELSFPLTLYLPADAARPRGCFLLIVNRNRVIITEADKKPRPFWPVNEIIARGYATAAFHNSDIAPDDPKGDCREGIFAKFDSSDGEKNDAERPADAWGTIAAWAWGASRALDYLVTEPALRGVPMAVVGHSRGGKTALWCGAQDMRVTLAISNNSGTAGAAITRGNAVESVEQINTRFPHWFARNYRKYNGAENELPVDQHELLALMAPRLVYVASAREDTSADIEAEFRSCVEASPIFQLYKLGGIGAAERPVINKPRHGGAIGYHLRPGKHNLLVEDWNYYMDYTDREWQRQSRHLPNDKRYNIFD